MRINKTSSCTKCSAPNKESGRSQKSPGDDSHVHALKRLYDEHADNPDAEDAVGRILDIVSTLADYKFNSGRLGVKKLTQVVKDLSWEIDEALEALKYSKPTSMKNQVRAIWKEALKEYKDFVHGKAYIAVSGSRKTATDIKKAISDFMEEYYIDQTTSYADELVASVNAGKLYEGRAVDRLSQFIIHSLQDKETGTGRFWAVPELVDVTEHDIRGYVKEYAKEFLKKVHDNTPSARMASSKKCSICNKPIKPVAAGIKTKKAKNVRHEIQDYLYYHGKDVAEKAAWGLALDVQSGDIKQGKAVDKMMRTLEGLIIDDDGEFMIAALKGKPTWEIMRDLKAEAAWVIQDALERVGSSGDDAEEGW